jgi:hypothetical protein
MLRAREDSMNDGLDRRLAALSLVIAATTTACGSDAKAPAHDKGGSGANADSGSAGATGSGGAAGSSTLSSGGKNGGQGGSDQGGSMSDAGPPGTGGAAGATAGSGGAGAGGRASSGGAKSTGGAAGSSTTGGGSACKGIDATVTAATASGAAVALTIDATATACTVAPDFAGTNFEAFKDWGADISMSGFQQTAFQVAGMQLFRYPGGEPAEWSDLLMTAKCKDGSNANYGSPSYTSLWTFAKSAGVGSLMLQTNPTTQWCGDGSQDASGAHAAALAKDAASHGVNAVYEIGNEPDLGGSFFAANQTAYFDEFVEQAAAIHQAAPKAEVYGPVVCGLGGNCSFPTTWDSGWIDAFLARTGNKASGDGKGTVDGISFHVYWHNEWGFSDLKEAKIDKYGFAVYWANTVMPYLRGIIAKHDTRDLPIAVSEISIGNGVANDSGQAQNMFTVLETLDTIGAFASSGLRSFQWFDANAAGPADFWMITADKTRPIYYAFAAWARMGKVVLPVTSSVNPHDVAAYATHKADGSVQVLLINKTSSSHDVTMTFDGFAAAGKALQVWSAKPATAGSDTATSVVVNGAPDPTPAAMQEPARNANKADTPVYTLPAYSIAVLDFAG